MSLAEEHYSRVDVKKEIVDFCKGRWVAAHYIDSEGKLVFRRYLRRKPLRINSPEEFSRIINLRGNVLRSIYATANLYWKTESIEEVYDLSNIRRCSPVWDIDGTLSNWKATLEVAREIGAFLNDRGVEKSLFFKWSGNGCHIHIHEEAFSDDLLRRYHPLDLAYAIVEYVNSKTSQRVRETLLKGRITVENKVDPTRVFTCPLSLHRELNVVCICFKPTRLSEFTPEWIRPSSFQHDPSWREFVKGEADEIAEDAYKTVGGYPLRRRRRRRRTVPLDKQIVKWLQKD
ncbi:hypothetical protein CW704_03225 [Candidatus Bathyarchaeota archaeon]|nr:MAG: hypothetical protein CW704_03225 [Candidatus Bathyarchaeota archaeon]RLI04154.1 MAG: hypothetical protein DRO38_01925 [Candidatus Bathyarchaeota archaeon]